MTDPYAKTLNTHQDGDCDKVSRNRIYNCSLQVPTVCGIDKYTLLDGLAYNTRGYFASCVVFFRAPQGRGKMRAMSKMSASIIC